MGRIDSSRHFHILWSESKVDCPPRYQERDFGPGLAT